MTWKKKWAYDWLKKKVWKLQGSPEVKHGSVHTVTQFWRSWKWPYAARLLMMSSGRVFRVVWYKFRDATVARCRLMALRSVLSHCDTFFSCELVTWPTYLKRTVTSIHVFVFLACQWRKNILCWEFFGSGYIYIGFIGSAKIVQVYSGTKAIAASRSAIIWYSTIPLWNLVVFDPIL